MSSQSAGWTSILLETYEQPGIVDAFETHASHDYLLVFPILGQYELESRCSRSWQKMVYRPGMVGITAPSTWNRLRWRAAHEMNTEVLRIYIPCPYFVEAAEEYRRAGVRGAAEVQDALGFSDPILFSFARAAAGQLITGYPDLCADSAAIFLATHLLAQHHRWPDKTTDRDPGFLTSEKRWRRVLDYMDQHFDKQVTLYDLAREAGVSRFHFCRLFRKRFQVTPHRYLTRVRMKHARLLLTETDLSIGEIGTACGYLHWGHFAAAFQREFGRSPSLERQLRTSSLSQPESGELDRGSNAVRPNPARLAP